MPLELTTETVGIGTAGVVGVGMMGRAIVTWMNRQGLITAGDSSQKELTDRLMAEAKRWEDRYDTLLKEHETSREQHLATIALLNEVKMQNRMLRMLLIQKGMSADDLDRALDLEDVTQ